MQIWVYPYIPDDQGLVWHTVRTQKMFNNYTSVSKYVTEEPGKEVQGISGWGR